MSKLVKRRIIICLFVISIIILLSGNAIIAQPLYVMYGSVKDTSGNPLPGTNLTFTCNSTGLSVSKITNIDGSFSNFAFGIIDYNSPQTGDPDPLGFIYLDGAGDQITLKGEKDGYVTSTSYFFLSSSGRTWINITLEPTSGNNSENVTNGSLLQWLTSPIGISLIIIIVIFIIVGLYTQTHFTKKEKERVDSRKRTKRKRL